MERFYKFAVVSLLAFGIAFSCFCLASPIRLAAACCCLLAGAVLWRQKCVHCGVAVAIERIDAGSRKWVTGVLVIGLMLRLAYVTLAPEVVAQSNMLERVDYCVLWERAGSFALGDFLENKSWVTVVFYGLVRRFFGDSFYLSYLFTLALQIMTALILGGVTQMLFGQGRWLSASIFFLFPYFVMHCSNIATEHCYVLFAVLSFYLMLKSARADGLVGGCVYAMLMGMAIWLALWSRSEGVLLWVVLPAGLAVESVMGKRGWRTVLLKMLLLGIVFTGGVCFACRVNARWSDSSTIFCSNDNLWPRLFGASVKHGGTINGEDQRLIYRRYLQDHPDCEWEEFPQGSIYAGLPLKMKATFPAEFVPYIEDEIRARWRTMSLCEMFCFIISKEYADWCLEPHQYGLLSTWLHRFGRGMSALAHAIILLAAFYGLIVARYKYKSLLAYIPIFFIAGNCLVLTMTECSARYGVALRFWWPIYATIGLLALRRRLRRIESC